MVPVRSSDGPLTRLTEGSVELDVYPSGTGKGPGKRSDIFYNPSMVQNRDLSVLLLGSLVKAGTLPGRDSIEVLDGLCGSGIRPIRFHREIGTLEGRVNYSGCDREHRAIEHARRSAERNNAAVTFFEQDLIEHLSTRKYSYIDVDPFGSPVPFIPQALVSLLSGGVLAVTATDTAALTGSASRAALRRYGAHLTRTDFMHELSCRVLACHIARTAASLDRAAEPLLFYSSDHFVRGYLRVLRSSRRADLATGRIGYISVASPMMPKVLGPPSEIKGEQEQIIGPVWIGDLVDTKVTGAAIEALSTGEPFTERISTGRPLTTMLTRAIEEGPLPMGGYDIDSVASYLRTSPPPMQKVIASLKEMGYGASRSRFSDTVLKTDAPFDVFKRFFRGREGG